MSAAKVCDIEIAREEEAENCRIARVLMDESREKMEGVLAEFAKAALAGGSLSTLSSQLRASMAPILSGILESTLQSVADSQIGPAPCPRCGTLVSKSRQRPRTFDTLHGQVKVSRSYYHCLQCRVGFSPFDEEAELCSGRKQDDLKAGALALAAEVPYETASELFEKISGVPYSVHAMHDLVSTVGGEASVQSILPTKETVDNLIDEHAVPGSWRPIVVITADGAHAPTRGAEARQRADKRGPGEWREVKGFRSYLVRHDRIEQIGSWHRICDEAEFGQALEKLGAIIDPARVRIATVADGAPWIINHFRRIFPKARHVLDYFHCKQHLWDVAKVQYPNDLKKQTEWVEASTARLFFNEVESVIWGLDRMKPVSETADLEIQKLRNYLDANRERLDYGSARRAQAPLGSGAIESSNKQMVQVRLKRPGAWWNVDGANAILAIRCAKFNGTLDKLRIGSKSREVAKS